MCGYGLSFIPYSVVRSLSSIFRCMESVFMSHVCVCMWRKKHIVYIENKYCIIKTTTSTLFKLLSYTNGPLLCTTITMLLLLLLWLLFVLFVEKQMTQTQLKFCYSTTSQRLMKFNKRDFKANEHLPFAKRIFQYSVK